MPVHNDDNIIRELLLLTLLWICMAALIITYWVILFIICCGPSPTGHVRFRTLPDAGAQTYTNVKPNLLVTSRRAVNTDEPELLLTSTYVEFYTWTSHRHIAYAHYVTQYADISCAVID